MTGSPNEVIFIPAKVVILWSALQHCKDQILGGNSIT